MKKEELKYKVGEELSRLPEKKFKSELGEASVREYKKKQFDQAKAKELLGEEKVGLCMKEIDVSTVSIMSREAIDNRKQFLNKGKKNV